MSKCIVFSVCAGFILCTITLSQLWEMCRWSKTQPGYHDRSSLYTFTPHAQIITPFLCRLLLRSIKRPRMRNKEKGKERKFIQLRKTVQILYNVRFEKRYSLYLKSRSEDISHLFSLMFKLKRRKKVNNKHSK